MASSSIITKTMEVNCKTCNVKFFKTPNAKRSYCCKKCAKIGRKTFKKPVENKNNHYIKIFERDDFRCVYCGKSPIEDNVRLGLDHVYPISEGGDSNPLNLVACCDKCNSLKSNTIIHEKVILRIWKRNFQLRLKIKVGYIELQSYFDKHFRARALKSRRHRQYLPQNHIRVPHKNKPG